MSGIGDKIKKQDDEKRAYSKMLSFGWTPEQASGIVGNLVWESRLNTSVLGTADDKGSRGIAQWHSGRLQTLQKRYGNKWTDLDNQLEFVNWELNNTHRRAGDKLRASRGVYDTGKVVSDDYEIPKDKWNINKKRQAAVYDIHKKYSGLEVTDADMYSSTSTAGTGYEGEVYRPYTPPSMIPTEGNVDVQDKPEDTEEEVAAKERIDKVEKEQDILSTYFSQNSQQQPQEPQQEYQQPQQQSPEILDQYAQVSQFVNAPVAQQGGSLPCLECGGHVEVANLDTYQTGGFIQDNRGQWAHPGKKTEINSPNITMQGVDYPVLGISKETGERKMMMPNEDYYFKKTDSVLEIPYMQEAGKVDSPFGVPKSFLEMVNPEYAKAIISKRAAVTPRQPNISPFGTTQNLTDDLLRAQAQATKTIQNLPAKKVDSRFANLKPKDERLEGLTKIDGTDAGTEVSKVKIDEVVKDVAKKQANLDNELKARKNTYDTRSNSLDVIPEVLKEENIKLPEDVKALQTKLVNAGYNLNPSGKFENSGIDGKLGSITRQAIKDYNDSGEKGSYNSYKKGVGELGQCKEGQCSEYAQNEIFRNLKPNVDRATWNQKTGITGDAWRIGSNIVKAGGKAVSTKAVREGDFVTMYTGGISPSLPDARKYGTDATHVGVVDKVNPDGSYYILHNVHSKNYVSGEYTGHERRDLIKPNGEMPSQGFTARGAYRPAYDKVDTTGKNVKVREDVGLKFNEERNKDLNQIDKSIFGEDVKGKIEEFLAPLNDIANKRVLAQKHNLSETEYQSLAKVALGVIGQESSFDTSAKRIPKQVAANFLSKIGYRDAETSAGASQLKYKTNYGNSDLTELGINSRNFVQAKNTPLVTLDVLAKHYRTLLNTGIGKEKALYKAVEKYNRGHNTKYSETQDSDYVNKVLGFSDMFDVTDKVGTQYNTLTDKINLNINTIKRQKRLAKK